MTQRLIAIQEDYKRNLANIEKSILYIESHFLESMKTNKNIASISPTFYANQTINNVCVNVSRITKEMKGYIDQLYVQLDSIIWNEISEGDPTPEDATPDGDILNWLVRETYQGEYSKELLLRKTMGHVEFMSITKGPFINGERYHELYEKTDEVKRLIEIAINISNKRRYYEIQDNIRIVENFVQALDLFNSANHLNIYRQSFIQIMAYFDSCIFKIMQICLEKDFFNWLKSFENTTIKRYDLAQYKSFLEFQSAQINSMLKACYAKELLKIINAKEKNLFKIGEKNIFSSLCEMINRRNIHIHHDGIVDEKYLSEFNIYTFEKDMYLEISKEYLQEAITNTENVTTNISNHFSGCYERE